MDEARARLIVGWVLAVLMTLAFLAAGIPKIFGRAAQNFASWGYPAWLAVLIGVAETLGGIGLLIPGLVRYATAGLVLVTLGAALTHVRAAEWGSLTVPLSFTVVLVVMAWLRREPRASTPS